MIGYIIFIFILSIISLCVSVRYKMDSFFSIPLTFCGITLLTYLLGMLDLLFFGIMAFISIGAFALFLLYKNKNYQHIRLIDLYPYAIFLVFAIIFYRLNINRKVWAGDDLYHWGLVAKNVFYWNKFCIEKPITIQYTNYPELSAIPGYIVLKLNRTWDEGVLFSIQALWGSTFLFPLFHRKEERHSYIGDFIVFGVVSFLPLFFSSRYTAYNCLQVDRELGFAFAFCIIIAISGMDALCNKRTKMICLVIALSTLASIKETGLYLGIITIVFLVLYRFVKSYKTRWSEICILICCILLPQIMWSCYLKIHDVFEFKTMTAKSFTLDTAISILSGTDEIRGKAFRDGIKKLLTISSFRLGSNGSYIIWMFFFLVSFITVCIINNKRNLLKRAMVFAVSIFICMILWWGGILYVILFKFTNEEIQILASFERYMDTFIIGILFAILYFVFYECELKNKKSVFAFGTIVFLLTGFTYRNIASNVKYILMDIPSTNTQRNEIDAKIDSSVKRSLIKETDKVYIISCDEEGAKSAEYYNCVFNLAPIPVNLDFSKNESGWRRFSYLLSAEEEDSEYEETVTYYSADDFAEVLKEYTHLLILNRNQRFDDSYAALFEDNKVENGFYKIEKGQFVTLVKYE